MTSTMVRHRRSPRPGFVAALYERRQFAGIGSPVLTCRKAGQLRLLLNRVSSRRAKVSTSRRVSGLLKGKYNYFVAATLTDTKRMNSWTNARGCSRLRALSHDIFFLVTPNGLNTRSLFRGYSPAKA